MELVIPKHDLTSSEVRKPMQGYNEKLHYLFPKGVDMSKIFYDDEGLRFVTYNMISNRVMYWIIELRNKLECSKGIIDGSASLGGDTLTFGLSGQFSEVIAIELDYVRYVCLIENVKLYKLKRVFCINTNFIDWFRANYQNYYGTPIFLDPPFGGDNYLKFDVIDDLFLIYQGEKYSLIKFVEEIMKLCPLLVMKLPFNFNVDSFSKFKKEVRKDFHKKLTYVAIFETLSL